jgi:UDP-N-acetylmuramoyl-tripeptide--D-alanyl-D-alanine ligase
MKAALAVLGASEAGRRLAALGDMRELGAHSARYHAELAEPVAGADVDLVFTCGPEMAALRAALPEHRRGGHADSAAALAPQIAATVRAGDTILVKGSAGAQMASVVAALRELGTARTHTQGRQRQSRAGGAR